jgi:hypothetical protein
MPLRGTAGPTSAPLSLGGPLAARLLNAKLSVFIRIELL